MAKTRPEFHEFLIDISGCENAYFQPPASLKLKYPCLIYLLSGNGELIADDDIYHLKKEYQVIVVDRDPDSAIADRFIFNRRFKFQRSYQSDGLNHFVFTIKY